MTEMQKLLIWIMKITVLVLASVLVSVVFAAIVGLFMPNELIDNKEIFALIGPAFQTIVGAFVGLLGGLSISDAAKHNTPKDDNTDSE
jgi:hypothetical protein